jgi:hypothetical protein
MLFFSNPEIRAMSDPISPPNRRSFIKKSLAGVFIASQPLVLTGLLRASGTGVEGKYYYGSFDTTNPYSDPPETTVWNVMDTTVVDWGSTELETTFIWYF